MLCPTPHATSPRGQHIVSPPLLASDVLSADDVRFSMDGRDTRRERERERERDGQTGYGGYVTPTRRANSARTRARPLPVAEDPHALAVKELVQSNAMKQSQIDKLQRERETQTQALQAATTDLTEWKTRYRREISAKETALGSLRAEYQAVQRDLQSLRSKEEGAKRDRERERERDVQSDREERERERQEVERETRSLEAKNLGLQKQVSTMRTTLETQHQETLSLRQKLEEREASLSALSGIESVCQAAEAEAREAKEALAQREASAASDMAQLRLDLETARETIDNMTDQAVIAQQTQQEAEAERERERERERQEAREALRAAEEALQAERERAEERESQEEEGERTRLSLIQAEAAAKQLSAKLKLRDSLLAEAQAESAQLRAKARGEDSRVRRAVKEAKRAWE
ncbi:hypothetical protein KIPB_008389, partial [Kipferlia bialata]|eukprot:g8389.t1